MVLIAVILYVVSLGMPAMETGYHRESPAEPLRVIYGLAVCYSSLVIGSVALWEILIQWRFTMTGFGLALGMLANVLWIISALLMLFVPANRRSGRLKRITFGAAMLGTLSATLCIPVLNNAGEGIEVLSGYYVWLSSFCLLVICSLLKSEFKDLAKRM